MCAGSQPKWHDVDARPDDLLDAWQRGVAAADEAPDGDFVGGEDVREEQRPGGADQGGDCERVGEFWERDFGIDADWDG